MYDILPDPALLRGGKEIHERAKQKVDLARKKCQVELKKLRAEQDTHCLCGHRSTARQLHFRLQRNRQSYVDFLSDTYVFFTVIYCLMLSVLPLHAVKQAALKTFGSFGGQRRACSSGQRTGGDLPALVCHGKFSSSALAQFFIMMEVAQEKELDKKLSNAEGILQRAAAKARIMQCNTQEICN